MRRLAVLLLAVVLSSPTPALAADNPRATLSSPTDGASVPLNEPLLVIGDSYNGEAGGVIRVDVTTDDGATWTSIDTQSYWSLVVTPTVPGPLTIKARAHTASTAGPLQALRTVHVGGTTLPPLCCETFLSFPYIQRPNVKDIDEQAVELGVRITVDRPGSLVGMHLRRGNYSGPVTARVWSSGGVLLTEQDVPGGQTWHRVTFTTPVHVAPGNEYVVSYYTPSGGYLSTENYFVGNLVQTPFRAPVNAGVYRYGGGFPTDTWNSSNYWVMPIFQP